MHKDEDQEIPGANDGDRATTKAQIAGLQQELKEALDRQTATGEILRVISSSSKDVQQVFDTIVQNRPDPVSRGNAQHCTEG